MKQILLLFTLLLLTGCSTFFSNFDKTKEIWNQGKAIKAVEVPEGFVVKPEEVRKFLPILSKLPMGIFVDYENYYLFKSKGFFYNSTVARKEGIKLSGTNRETFTEQTKKLDTFILKLERK